MYAHIQKIIIKNRMNIQVTFWNKIIEKMGGHLTLEMNFVLKTICKCLGNIFFSVGCFFLGKQFVSYDMLKAVLLVLSISIGAAKGVEKYKNIYMPNFEEWLHISCVDNKKLYYTLLRVELFFSFVLSGDIISFVFCTIILEGLTAQAIITGAYIILIWLLAFILASLLMGKYNYSLVTKRIQVFRLFIYIVNSIVIVFISSLLVKFSYNVLYSSFLTENIDFISDEYWIEAVNSVKTTITIYGQEFIFFLQTLNKMITVTNCLIVLFLLLVILHVPIDFITTLDKYKKNYDDMLDKYTLFLQYINKKSYVSKQFLYNLKLHRWSIVKSVYQIVFINYEAIAYIGIIVGVLHFTKEPIMIIHLLIILNIQVLSNQAFEIRQVLKLYYSFNDNIKELYFLKLYFDHYPIGKEKEKIMRLKMVIPLMIMYLFDFFCMFIYKLNFLSLVTLLGVATLYFFLSAKIQTHMLPSIANFQVIDKHLIDDSFEETELADTLQEIPRNFTNVIPMTFTVPLILCKEFQIYIVVLELVYIVCAFLFTKFYCDKILEKGTKILYEKVV